MDETTRVDSPSWFAAGGGGATVLAYYRDGSRAAPLPPSGELVIGRAAPSTLILDDRSLSREHARLSVHDGVVTVEDLGSTNGTWVNGERIARARVTQDDEIRLGEVTIVLHFPRPGTRPRDLLSYDRFLPFLEDEVIRARSFGRPLSLAVLRHASVEAVEGWLPKVAATLREVDRVAVYAPDTLVVAMPEVRGEGAVPIVTAAVAAEGAIRAGVAAFPDDAASAEELLAEARERLREATDRAPVVSGRAAPTAAAYVAESPAMRAVAELVRRVAASNLSLLILGETGTGKEVAVRSIHAQSQRAAGPLKTINCAAIPATLLESMIFGHEKGAFTGATAVSRGIFEQAQGGTVFLDEIGELSAQAQAALLRVLETRRVVRLGGEREIDVDVRLVAATHRDLESMCETGQFRRDLLFRLDGVTIALPPLRERGSDIDRLSDAFLREANVSNGRAVSGLSAEARALLHRYTWPGNVRELKNAIERAVVVARGSELTPDDLPERVRSGGAMTSMLPPPPGAPSAAVAPSVDVEIDFDDGGDEDYKTRVRNFTQRYEAEIIVDALNRANGNQTRAADLLKIPLRTLVQKMKDLGIRRSFG